MVGISYRWTPHLCSLALTLGDEHIASIRLTCARVPHQTSTSIELNLSHQDPIRYVSLFELSLTKCYRFASRWICFVSLGSQFLCLAVIVLGIPVCLLDGTQCFSLFIRRSVGSVCLVGVSVCLLVPIPSTLNSLFAGCSGLSSRCSVCLHGVSGSLLGGTFAGEAAKCICLNKYGVNVAVLQSIFRKRKSSSL